MKLDQRQTGAFTSPPRTVTIRDIAKLAGLSAATISRALKNEPGLADTTRQTVIRIAQQLGYDFGKLQRKKFQRIAFLLHHQHNTTAISPLYITVLRGAEEACRKQGMTLSFAVVNPKITVGEHLPVDTCDAIVCAGSFELKQLQSLRATGKPMVLIDMKAPGYSSVNPDNFLGGYQATRHLLGLGRAKIGMISGPPGDYSSRERYRGYRQALFDADVPADPRYEVSIGEGRDPAAGAHEAMRTLLDLPHPPDAVFCFDDASALVAMRACLAAGLHVPHDMSIVGFDDIPDAMLGHRPLTTSRIDMKCLGATGIELLLSSPHDPPVEKILPVELIVRCSTVHDDSGRRRDARARA